TRTGPPRRVVANARDGSTASRMRRPSSALERRQSTLWIAKRIPTRSWLGLSERRSEFVIRSFQDRVLVGNDEARLREVARAARPSLRREVPLSPRPRIPGPKGERHPARRFRIAKLSIAALAVELPRTSDKRTVATVKANVIHVFEKKPPAGEPSVEWFLLTNLP